MSNKDENRATLIHSQPTALFRAGAASLATRGLHDLLESETADHWRYKGDEAENRQDYTEAMRCWRMAADQGDVLAMYKIGCLYCIGNGVTQDYAESMRWFCSAADNGNAKAMWIVGFLYRDGQGVVQDYAEAMRWWHMAADQGNVGAMHSIGSLYSGGNGVEQDYAEAMRWWRMAADKVNGNAMYWIGHLYHIGKGVTRDLAVAAYWYEKAIKHGGWYTHTENPEYTEAGRALAKLLELGVIAHAPEGEGH